MIAKATKYEKLLKARGAGAFGKVEYDGELKVILRTADVKTADLSGTVRVYFNNKREQVMSGRRFDPMGSNLVLLRPGAFYRIHTTTEIAKPIPEGVSALVVLNEDAADVVMVTTRPFRAGYVGLISFTIQPFRRIELEKMTSIASLMFFDETVNVPDVCEDKVRTAAMKAEIKKIIKDTLKKSIPASNRKPTKSTKEQENADSVSDQPPDNPES
jgi:hypothetical protein